MSDPWNAAWEEAEATAPPGVVVYYTLEFMHPAFVDDSVPFSLRCVTGVPEPIELTLEDDAILNAGQTVEFLAIPFRAERPTYEEGKTPECTIIVDNVAREMMPYLEEAVSMRADLQVTYREYRSDGLDAPCYGPITFTMKQVTVTNTALQGSARLEDLGNRKFPSKVYTIREFPGLLP